MLFLIAGNSSIVSLIFDLCKYIPGVLRAEAGPGQPRSVDDAMDNAGAYRRLVGGQLEL